MIDPEADDVGRRVVYRPAHGAVESGVITSFNESFVFVRYGNDTRGQATRREDLEWECAC